MSGRYGAYLVICMLALVLVMPGESFGQSPETLGMMLHDSVTDAFNSEPRQLEQKPPVALNTGNDLYRVELTWEPVEIKPNKIVSFDIKIIDLLTNKPVENVYYDFAVVKDGQPIKELNGSFARNGLATHTVEFPSSGSFSVEVNVLGSGELNQKNESAAFDLKAVPEFPAGTIIVMVTLVAITVALTRFTVLNKKVGRVDPSAGSAYPLPSKIK